MRELGEKCTVWLILTSVVVLVVNYGLATGEISKISLGLVYIDNIKPSRIFIFALTIGLLGGLMLGHIKTHWDQICARYSIGYRESSVFSEYVREQFFEAVGDERYGAPVGGLKGTLFPRSQNLGRFTTAIGNITREVIITPSVAIHRSALMGGIRRIFTRGLWIKVHLPFLLGIWALCSVII